ncbi:NlpC/P60 family protein [Planotetraspora sp. A-T 1434]|uniref:C40 family peptidase n=1 Tax=Planotetraspora sp. A-T 1434 TaxID=2979219 RepID=UPI0021C0DF55|nr:C40 family peptidase [Planotetraspora sp. A-T 1434]MCT9929749.1 NlpC/P60 family protein [Planotetraspora sp. A-T 1434]
MSGPIRRLVFVGVALTMITVGAPMVSATADPKPSLKQLTAEVESLYTEIETLTEEYNGERVRLKSAERSAAVAKKTLAKSESELAVRRQKASLVAQNSYMTGGLGSPLAMVGSTDPEAYLDQASATYALEMQQGQEVAEVANAMKAAERAKASATARQAEVKNLLAGIEARRTKIGKLVKKAESSLYSKVAGSVSGGRATRLSFPVIGDGKAAAAARWALSQQMKPYVWGAAGPSTFDCSGLIMAAYQTVGISLPHYTGDQWTSGTHVSRDDLRPGDLVFFYSDLHHVGMYIGGGYMVHAPHTGDVVRIAKLGNRPFAGAVRIAD